MLYCVFLGEDGDYEKKTQLHLLLFRCNNKAMSA